jgi:hypothetical protein
MLSSFKDVFTEIPKAYNSLSLVKYLSEIFLVLGSFDIHEFRTPFVTPIMQHIFSTITTDTTI